MVTQTKPQPPSRTPAVIRNNRPPGGVLGIGVEKLASGLGWFSIGLGMAELFAPQAIARLTGASDGRKWIRGFGLREIASGVTMLNDPRRGTPVWSRVAGDVMDLMALAPALVSGKNGRARTAGSLAAVAGVTVLDVLCARELSRRSSVVRASGTIIVNCSLTDCYRFWRNFENLPRFMRIIESVRTSGPKSAQWTARISPNRLIEWNTEITKDLPDEQISWRSVAGSCLNQSASIRFNPTPGGRGTLARIKMGYSETRPSNGILPKLLGQDAERTLGADLRRFKQLIETGEVLTTEGQSMGRKKSTSWMDSIAS